MIPNRQPMTTNNAVTNVAIRINLRILKLVLVDRTALRLYALKARENWKKKNLPFKSKLNAIQI